MRRALTTLATATALICGPTAAVIVTAGSATAGDGAQVCLGLTSGKIDTKGDPQVVTVRVPAGQQITGYCVKAGSVNQANGPVYVALAEPVPTLDIRHPSGKAVSHYSYSVGPIAVTPTGTPSAQPSGAPSETPSTVPSGTPSGTPSETPSATPSTVPSPSDSPTEAPSPSDSPTEAPSPSDNPTEAPSVTNPPAVDAGGNFDWNWRYDDPSCSALYVEYPSNIPEGQSNDVNVRVWTDSAGELTLNFHNDRGTWSGNQAFVYNQHRNWPAGVTRYAVIWTQVGGSNYHYGEMFHQEAAKAPLTCRVNTDGDSETYDVPLAETGIAGFDTRPVVVRRGASARADVVTVIQPGLEQLVLQKQSGAHWHTVGSLTPGARTTVVSFPREVRRGVHRYRLSVPESESVTGATSGILTVRVR